MTPLLVIRTKIKSKVSDLKYYFYWNELKIILIKGEEDQRFLTNQSLPLTAALKN